MLKFRRIILWIVILSLVITIPLLSYAKSLPKFSFGSRLLYTGTYGTDVLKLQTILEQAGFDVGTIDGIFGAMTLNGVLDFQREKHLKVDGIVGPQTYAALENVHWTDPLVYTIKPGDNLYTIAKKNGTTVEDILKANDMDDPDNLYVGQQILIPHPPVVVPPELYGATNYQELKQNIEKLISQYPGKYGVYFIDLNTGQTFEINGYDPFIAASTYKVPLNFYLYTLITEGKIDPNMKVQYTKVDYEGGAGSIQFEPVGSYYTIRELSRRSIVESDNIASNMIMRVVGRDNYIKFMENLGAKVIPYSSNIASPYDMSMYMKKLLEYANEHPDTAGELMYYLKNTIYGDRISYPIPDNIEVAHKVGNLDNVVNDTAIVFHPTKPYILTILANNVDGSDNSYAYTVIRQISKMVYDFQNK